MSQAPAYPIGLEPDGHEEIRGTDLRVPAKMLRFKHWKGAAIRDDFGGKPIVEYDRRPVFAELAIRKIVSKEIGWTAFWQETYPPRKIGPYYFTDWKEDLLRKDQHNQSLNELGSSYHRDLLLRLKKHNNDSFSGFWDVVAWKGQHILFIESKWKDDIGQNQKKWLSFALSSELGLELTKNFLIFRWKYDDG